jgi:phenylacetate-CoA ligase
MVDLERAYLRLPTVLQHVACSVEGLRIQRSRFGRGFEGILAEVSARDRWSRGRLEELRRARVQEFVRRAFRAVPYYRALAREHGIDPASLREPADLARLPILEKWTIQARPDDFIAEGVAQRKVIAHTSGSTGAGLRFATTLSAIQEQWAVWWRYRGWHGVSRRMWCGYFGGRSVVAPSQSKPPFWRYNVPGRQILFSGYHVSDEHLPAYVAELRRRRPPWLHGYPSLLTLLAGHLLATGTGLGYPLVAVTTGAENLLPHQMQLLERAFGVRPRQHYGLAEAAANISECERSRMHIDEDFAVVELVPTGDGESCRIIGTNLSNPATPLIRYDTGDVARPSAETTCACGRAGRLVERVDGRQEDYVVLANGARVGRMDHVFKDLVAIREAQIVQERIGAITVRVVRGPSYTEASERELLAEIQKRIGADAEVAFEYPSQLERTATGKLRFVVSRLAGGRLVGKG